MARARFAVRLLALAARCGGREALVGDLLEEITYGRSRWWVYQQVIGLYAWALATQARDRVRLTPGSVTCVLSVFLLGAVLIVPISSVLETWLVCYAVAGTASLVAHVVAQSNGWRTLVISET